MDKTTLSMVLVSGAILGGTVVGAYNSGGAFKQVEPSVEEPSTLSPLPKFSLEESGKDKIGSYLCLMTKTDGISHPNDVVVKPESLYSEFRLYWEDKSHKNILIRSDDWDFNGGVLKPSGTKYKMKNVLMDRRTDMEAVIHPKSNHTKADPISVSLKVKQQNVEAMRVVSHGCVGFVRQMLSKYLPPQQPEPVLVTATLTSHSLQCSPYTPPVAAPSPPKTEKHLAQKAVFIRPKQGEFFSVDWMNVDKAALVGCTTPYECSLASVAQDLIASGITDVFIAFKTDGSAWTPSGHIGDLAYPSALYPDRVDSTLKKEIALQPGFDPIKNLMDALQSEYDKAGKTIHIHAWFPVFADWYAAQIAPQRGSTDIVDVTWQPIKVGDFTVPVIQQPTVSNFGLPKGCHSDSGADPTNPKVVELELSELDEITTKYQPYLYGINLDYIRYYFATDPKNEPCRYDSDGTIVLVPFSWNVHPEAIENFVKTVNARYSNLTISADIFATDDNRQKNGQAGIPNLLKIAMPMVYSRTDQNDNYMNEVTTEIELFHMYYYNTTILPIIKGFAGYTPKGATAPLIPLTKDFKNDVDNVISSGVNACAVFNYEYLLTNTNYRTLASLEQEDNIAW